MTIDEAKIEASRSALGSLLKGTGIEVGAGSRPFPVPESVKVFYGDIRDSKSLVTYFPSEIPTPVRDGSFLDAQTLSQLADSSVDFVISAHVLEHLFDPIGSIQNSIRVLRPGGLLVLVVPDMRFTFDCTRPPTGLEHMIRDSFDGGLSTRRHAYEEHVRYVHAYLKEPIPEEQVSFHVEHISSANMDIHVHAWSLREANELLNYCASRLPIRLEATHSIVNENQFIVRRVT